jgi:hypothetical protein
MTDLDKILVCTVTFRTVSQGAKIKAAIDAASPKLMHSVAVSRDPLAAESGPQLVVRRRIIHISSNAHQPKNL